MVEEARLEKSDQGLAPATDGWFVVNVRDGAWVTNEKFGAAFTIEGDATPPFGEIGYTLVVLAPGQVGMYHRESNQEDFFVLAGECLLLVEGEERRLEAGDFVHCPPDTEHGFVGAGERPCVIFMAGGRTGEKRIVYPRSDVALRHGAGVETETTKPAEAYAPFPKWQDGRPEGLSELPWA
jgi:quercetin dioxygenase-like cupin family protein